jgi:hypothetical protein
MVEDKWTVVGGGFLNQDNGDLLICSGRQLKKVRLRMWWSKFVDYYVLIKNMVMDKYY